MSAGKLPPLPKPLETFAYLAGKCQDLFGSKQMEDYGLLCRVDLLELVRAVHQAKGRYHSQIAMCDLYDACGLPSQRPEKGK